MCNTKNLLFDYLKGVAFIAKNRFNKTLNNNSKSASEILHVG